VLQCWRSAKVETDQLIPEIAAPEEAMSDFDILVRQFYGGRVFLTINTYAHVLDQPESHPAVKPCLRSVASTALLCAEQ
jgi:hypothetical protein